MRKGKSAKKIVLFLILIVAVVAGIMVLKTKDKKKEVSTVRQNDIVTRGDIKVSISGSAAVEPLERYEIIPKVSGDITYCPYEVGDLVQKDDILYMFDSSDTDLTVERQKISMQQSENDYNNALEEEEKLTLIAKNNGIISGLTVKVGEEIKNGTKVATIEDTTVLEVELPFTQSQIGAINVGDAALITSSKHMSSISGTVTHKAMTSYAGNDGSALYNVKIEFENPGAFYAGMEVGGSVGQNISPGSGVVANTASGTVESETEGIVSNVYCTNGDYVTKGTVIMTLTSKAIADKIENSTLAYKSASLSMQQTEKDLENYNITSPISGTVITKNSKAGDTIDKTNSATTMMVIADISKLKFELAIDELDISKVRKGQSVSVTCDALPDEEFTGIITNVSVEGTAQNGVTTYSAEVEIANPGNLRPSMNIDAEIIVEAAENVLLVPTEDIKSIADKKFVFAKDERAGEEKIPQKGGAESKKPFDENSSKKPSMPEMDGSEKGKDVEINKGFMPDAPEGYIAVEVQIGISNEDYTEIIGGLSEGQEIYKQSTQSSGNRNMMMGTMPGGMHGGMGGGMPSGMGGRMPTGGSMR